jgi:hypothetical protein
MPQIGKAALSVRLSKLMLTSERNRYFCFRRGRFLFSVCQSAQER